MLRGDRKCYAVIENFSRRRRTSPHNSEVLCVDVMRRRVVVHIAFRSCRRRLTSEPLATDGSRDQPGH